jgi:hypothetical protein
MTGVDGAPAEPDPAEILARAERAQHRAELLTDWAIHIAIESMITVFRAERVPLSPVVEARLHLLLGRPAATGGHGTRDAEVRPDRPAISELGRLTLQQRLGRPGSPDT